NKEISLLKKEDSAVRKKQAELKSRIEEAQSRNMESRRRFASLQSAYDQWRSILAQETVSYALEREMEFPYHGRSEIIAQLLMQSAVKGKYSLLAGIKGKSVSTYRTAEQWSKTGLTLKAKTGLLEEQRSARKAAWSAKQAALNRTKQKSLQILKEVEYLKNSALGLTRLVQRLGTKSPYRITERVSEIPIPRNSLQWPVQGRVISSFGKEEVPALKTWLVREGIRIKTAGRAQVRSILDGKVIYAGPFRSYGKVVIMDHKEGFFTVFGLLGKISVKKDEWLEAGSVIGISGPDTQTLDSRSSGGSALYFEIRSGADAVNPINWLMKKH
ncbi:MAG: peptidoglycan DD-metalloendopeptidase family protein, partial [bacterium]